MKDKACQMSIKELERLKNTLDDDLLDEFPGHTRGELRRLKKQGTGKAPRILIFDIETSFIEAYVWGTFKQDISINQIKRDWNMLCWSAKWLYDDKIIHDRLKGGESKKGDDKRITKSLWKLLEEADMIVAHNGDSFDIKKANARFLFHRLGLPKPIRQIDTLKVARKNFRITSNKLDYLCHYLGLEQKINTGGSELWISCMNGDEKALKKMDEYCQNDVKILEELYLELRPYDKTHPDVGLYMETSGKVCPNCGSKELKWGGFYTTLSNKYKTARCKCGAIIRSKIKI